MTKRPDHQFIESPSVTTLRLIEPNIELEESHKSFLEEYQRRGESVHPWVVAEPYDRFSDYVAMLNDASKGLRLPPKFVAHSTFWLVDADNEIVAISNLRHELNDFLLAYGGHVGYGVRPSVWRRGYATEILKQTLVRAKERGIDKVRISCSKDNLASSKAILRNGGKLDDEVFIPEHGEVICRYWIDL